MKRGSLRPAPSPRTQAFLGDTGRPVLAKPFTLDALRAALAPFARAIQARRRPPEAAVSAARSRGLEVGG